MAMNAELLSPPQPPPKAVVIDLSANMLDQWFESERLRKQRQTRARVLSFGLIAACAVGFVTLQFLNIETEKTLAGLRTKTRNLEHQLKTAASGMGTADVDAVQALPTQFKSENEASLGLLSQCLAQVQGAMSLSDLKMESATTGLKASGNAVVADLRTMRLYLDRVQAAVKGSQGMMISVAQVDATTSNALRVQFEVTVPRATPAPQQGGFPAMPGMPGGPR